MVKLLDGPATGQTLMLHRAPLLMRVTRDRAGRWDALDNPDDTVSLEETVFVYRRTGTAGTVHLNAGKASGFYALAEYHYWHGHPVSPYAFKFNSGWQSWARLHQYTPTPPPCR